MTTSGDSAMTPALQLDGKRALLLPGFVVPNGLAPEEVLPNGAHAPR